MSGFQTINARPTSKCKCPDSGVGRLEADDETKADGGMRAVLPSPGVDDTDTTDIERSDSEGHRSSQNTPDTESATDQTTSNTNTHDSAALPPLDPNCESFNQCRAQSGDYRKVVSHIFGRNKAETRRIPDNCWVKWCRMHYQRRTYRGNSRNNWHLGQLELVREQLSRFEERTNIQSWTIGLRKKEQRELDLENAAVAAGLITLASPSSATSIQSSSTTPNAAHIAGSSTTSPTVTAVVLDAAASATIPAESMQTSSSATICANDLDPCSGSTAKNETNIIFTPGATTSTSSKTSDTTSTTPKNPSVRHSNALSAASSAADDEADNTDVKNKATSPQVWERFLVPYLGPQKTFADVRAVCDVVERSFGILAFEALNKKRRVFPGIEFLPIFPDAKVKKTNAKSSTSTTRGTKRKAADMKTAAPAVAGKRRRVVRDVKG